MVKLGNLAKESSVMFFGLSFHLWFSWPPSYNLEEYFYSQKPGKRCSHG
jgi:hypothetical protein